MQDELKSFLKNLESLSFKSIDDKEFKGSESLQQLILGAYNRVLKEEALNIMARGFDKLRDNETVSLFKLELQYFNARFDKEKLQTEDVKDGLTNGKTIKDSLEKLIGKYLPDWIKRTLKIINEILSIAKTFA